jgi:acyl transferase domain-containing protein
VCGALRAFAAGERCPPVRVETANRDARVAFVCAGQSETRVGMGAAIYEASPIFRATIDRCSAVAEERLGASLSAALYGLGAPDLLDDARFAQPALFALQAALVALWRDWGVEPSAVTGHSLGEYAAAYAAGVLSLDEGIRLVTRRGQLTHEHAVPGRMAVVFCDEKTVRNAASQAASKIAIAAVNAPDVVVVSGPAAEVAGFVDAVKARDIPAKPLRISHAFHSACMDAMLPGLEQAAWEANLSAAEVPFVSMLEGRLIAAEEAARPSYWRRHAREPVRFLDAVRELARSGYGVFLELGPHKTLTALGERCTPEGGVRWTSSLRRSGDDLAVLGEAACALWLAGVDLDFGAVTRTIGWRSLDRDASE